MLRHVLLLVLCTLWLPVQAEESFPYTPPRVGTQLTVDISALGQTFTGVTKVTQVRGNLAEIQLATDRGTKRSVYFRGLVALQSGEMAYDFDEDALEALWPLAVGKRLEDQVIGRIRGRELTLAFSIEVEAVESITIPAGTFTTLRLRYGIQTGEDSPINLHVETLSWYDPSRSLPLKSEMEIFGDAGSQTVTMVAQSVSP